ncbi:MAG: DUF72 domain-containing protein [Anaerolineae bacterium]|nr:DUF72 domain-containing protein [Anaerolineae bacterium]
MNPRCHIGTSGWVYPHWRGVFYPSDLPQSRWFDFYARHFTTVEINNSFYRLPAETTFDRWQAQAPPGFIYAVKANRFLTHLKRLKDVAEPLERFLSRARRLGHTLGPILWQLPPRWHADPVRLETFAALLPTDVTNVFEFRDPSWFVPAVREILERFRLGFCVFDMPNLPCPLWVTSAVVYLRFHGAETTYAGRYGRAGLEPWAERIRQWLAEGRTVFAYFNNDAFGHAVEDAQLLQELMTA